MSQPAVKPAWYRSPFGGLFSPAELTRARAHDPAVRCWAGLAPSPRPDLPPSTGGAAGWDDDSAEAAGVGEAIERWQGWRLPGDEVIEASFASWPRPESAIAPERWVLFHPEQYALPDFPFGPLGPETVCRWVCFRAVGTGLPFWVPEELAYLAPAEGECTALCPMTSTGLSAGRVGQPVVLRGLQECIERDALMGAWWGSYGLEEHPAEEVFDFLPREFPRRLRRPNLRYRFWRVVSPFSAHVTLAAVEGEDREGYIIFSIGAACRETRQASLLKAILEAVQGRHYVRLLVEQQPTDPPGWPTSFEEHALFYTRHPGLLGRTVLNRAARAAPADTAPEGLAALVERLGPDRPVLVRLMTPPGIASARLGWCVVRVVVPGLQPMHGHHGLPFLGGPLWAPRPLADWANTLPHPFP